MSTKPQHLVAGAALGLALAMSSCSSAPAVEVVAPGQESILAPAPLGETAPGTAGSGAVIHHRTTDLRTTDFRTTAPRVDRSRLDNAYLHAVELREQFDFAAAEQAFRELRDDPRTPRASRDRFHAEVETNASIVHGLHCVRRALDRGEFARASAMLRDVADANPRVPLAALMASDVLGIPGWQR